MTIQSEKGRSRKGAWIEIPITLAILLISYGRSRKGAWIEISRRYIYNGLYVSRSRKGAWIEISSLTARSNNLLSLPQGSVD